MIWSICPLEKLNLNPVRSAISVSNEELIITYEIIRDTLYELISQLGDFKNNEEFYYEIRSLEIESLSKVEIAARLVFLNKTSFNGLYRVNKRGQFNAAFGKRNNPLICDAKIITAASKVFSNITILCEDFKSVLNTYAQPCDFIFLDPPYVPVGVFANFNRYTKDTFSLNDQIKLKKQFYKLVSIWGFPIMTNLDGEFIFELYKDYRIEIIETRRSISSNSKTRKGKDIIIIGK